MNRAVVRRAALVAAGLLMTSGAGVQAFAATPAEGMRSSAAQPVPPGLPAGAAAAALMPEPTLSVPKGWPFPDEFSRTAGTGRLVDGAFEWTDWVYDAFGAAGNCASNSDQSSVKGCYEYPSGSADGDGADIFLAGVGLTHTNTVWRVDWNTLVDPNVPLAEWTFDTDNNAKTGAAAWPAGANVSSPGIDKALIVSAKGAELVNVVTGKTVAILHTTVDMQARSFLVSIPRSVLPVSGSWRIRLGAGLANSTGTGFALPDDGSGTAVPTASRLYNVTFRTDAQEPPTYTNTSDPAADLESTPVIGTYGVAEAVSNEETGNTWGEADQADTLQTGNVSKFSQVVNWSHLAAKDTTPAPIVHGWSTRWYVTSIKMGQGIDPGEFTQPQLLSRIQPYAVYVPANYTGKTATPLSWMLHGASQVYTWAETGQPRLTAELCEERDSICASPEGLGPVGYYIGAAENDFWQVWRQMALGFDIDPNRTIITGYSMGGVGAFLLSASYPSVFSEAMPLDGSYDAGCNYTPSLLASEGVPASDTEAAAFFTLPTSANRAGNLKWVPMVVSSAYPDELSIYPHILVDAARYLAAGDRFAVFSTTGGEHVVTEMEDGFATQVAALHGTPEATTNPGTIDYTWCPEVVSPSLGDGPRNVYWLSGLSERATGITNTSRVVADDHAIRAASETEVESESVVTPADAPPMTELTGTWKLGSALAAADMLTLKLANVATLTVDTAAAHLRRGEATVSSDGTVRLTLSDLAPGTVVRGPSGTLTVGSIGMVTVSLSAGDSAISW